MTIIKYQKQERLLVGHTLNDMNGVGKPELGFSGGV